MNQKDYEKLAKFLRFFINRPNHLAKYLIENDALRKEFLSKLSISDCEDMEKKLATSCFLDVEHMKCFYNKLIGQSTSQNFSEENLFQQLEKELNDSIKEERYEDAIRIRDYLKNFRNKKKTF